jgi:hypothetical protein
MAYELIETRKYFPNLLKQGLVGYWSMNEPAWDGTPAEVTDSSGQGNHGVAVNGATTVAGGKLDRGGSFLQASSQYVDCGSAPSVLPDVFTLAAWVKFTSLGQMPLAGFHNTSDQPSFLMRAPFGQERALFFLAPARYRYFTLEAPINDGAWHHIALVMPASGIVDSKCYMDGASQAVFSTVAVAAADAKNILTLGRTGGVPRYFDGQMDEVTLHNRALPADEIAVLYNAGASLVIPDEESFKIPHEVVKL